MNRKGAFIIPQYQKIEHLPKSREIYLNINEMTIILDLESQALWTEINENREESWMS